MCWHWERKRLLVSTFVSGFRLTINVIINYKARRSKKKKEWKKSNGSNSCNGVAVGGVCVSAFFRHCQKKERSSVTFSIAHLPRFFFAWLYFPFISAIDNNLKWNRSTHTHTHSHKKKRNIKLNRMEIMKREEKKNRHWHNLCSSPKRTYTFN